MEDCAMWTMIGTKTYKKCAQVYKLEEKNKRLSEELEDYHNAEKFVLSEDCPTDEVHCGCVVILKKQIKDQIKQIRKLTDALAFVKK